MGNKASTTDIVTFLQKVKRLITTGKWRRYFEMSRVS